MTATVSDKTQAALESIAERGRTQEVAGYAVMGAFMSFGNGALGDGLFGKLAGAAKWFVLWFGMVVPVYLFWVVAL